MEVAEESKLERLLRLAADEPAFRVEFYDLLMASEVYVLGNAAEDGGAENVHLTAGSQVQLQHWTKQDGSSVIPFFSSVEILKESIDGLETYLSLPAKALMEMTRGATLVLNPLSENFKEFAPEEVRQLLDEGVGITSEKREIKRDTEVLIGQPETYPALMVDSLTQLFVLNQNVNRAYLATICDQSEGEDPHLVLGIEATGDIESLLRKIGAVISDTVTEYKPVDLYLVQQGEPGLSDYFINKTLPFYDRAWGSKLSHNFGSGNA